MNVLSKLMCVAIAACLVGCATTSKPVEYAAEGVEIFPQAEENHYLAIAEGKTKEEKLYFDCKYRLAQLAIEKNLEGFYVRDKAKNVTVIPDVYTHNGEVYSSNTERIELRVLAVLGDSSEETIQYYDARDIISQTEKKTEEVGTLNIVLSLLFSAPAFIALGALVILMGA